MKQMTKLVCVIVILVFMAAPVFSGGETESKESEKDKPMMAIVSGSGGFGDQAYNDAGNTGLVRAGEDFDIVVKAVESRSVSDYETNFQIVAQLGAALVFGLGSDTADAAKVVAQKYPDTLFVLIDGNVDDVSNILSINYREEQSAFLAGALAAKMTKTGKIGFVLGMRIPVLERFEVGYNAGAFYANSDVETLNVYTGKFNDPGLGKETAITLYGEGADIIAAAAGACNLGVFDAAAEKGPGFWAMGAAAGQSHLAPNDIMADQVKRLDNTIYYLVEEYLKNGSVEGGRSVLGLESGGVGLIYGENSANISQELFDYIDDITEKVISGEIVVPKDYAGLEKFQASM
jgi:basic membrane protein A and related proteins